MTLRSKVTGFAFFVLASMLMVTTWSSLEKGIGEGFRYLFAERWGVGLAIFGNIAIAIYLLIEAKKLKPGDGAETLLLRSQV